MISDPWLIGFFALMTFRVIPTPIFGCRQNDPCSCSGGGFEIYEPLCAARSNGTVTGEVKNQTRDLYPSAFAILETHAVSIIVSISVAGFITAVFIVARAFNLVAMTRSEKEELEESNAELEKRNEEIQQELELTRRKLWLPVGWRGGGGRSNAA